MFYSWLIYLWATHTPNVGIVRDLCADTGGCLTLVVLGGVIFGQGRARVPLAVFALLGFMLWNASAFFGSL
jgi:hypothetical protein